jgi:hypothetical protein
MVGRSEITEKAWSAIGLLLPVSGQRGGQRQDHRTGINEKCAVNYRQWSSLPPLPSGSNGDVTDSSALDAYYGPARVLLLLCAQCKEPEQGVGASWHAGVFRTCGGW